MYASQSSEALACIACEDYPLACIERRAMASMARDKMLTRDGVEDIVPHAPTRVKVQANVVAGVLDQKVAEQQPNT